MDSSPTAGKIRMSVQGVGLQVALRSHALCSHEGSSRSAQKKAAPKGRDQHCLCLPAIQRSRGTNTRPP